MIFDSCVWDQQGKPRPMSADVLYHTLIEASVQINVGEAFVLSHDSHLNNHSLMMMPLLTFPTDTDFAFVHCRRVHW